MISVLFRFHSRHRFDWFCYLELETFHFIENIFKILFCPNCFYVQIQRFECRSLSLPHALSHAIKSLVDSMQNAVIDLQNICSNVNELHALSLNSILHALPFNSMHLLIMLSDIFGSFENRSFIKKNVF